MELCNEQISVENKFDVLEIGDVNIYDIDNTTFTVVNNKIQYSTKKYIKPYDDNTLNVSPNVLTSDIWKYNRLFPFSVYSSINPSRLKFMAEKFLEFEKSGNRGTRKIALCKIQLTIIPDITDTFIYIDNDKQYKLFKYIIVTTVKILMRFLNHMVAYINKIGIVCQSNDNEVMVKITKGYTDEFIRIYNDTNQTYIEGWKINYTAPKKSDAINKFLDDYKNYSYW